MAQMATISARIEKNDKARFDDFCSTVGLNASTAINLFVKAVLRRHEIPFTIESAEDPFYSESNIAEHKRRIQDLKAHKNIVEHEIIEVD
ncbi:MAG: type II toxin-antitoxin system RelB/DinJ family antitoxin [Treponema sp.]|nr:type II toxin-antitoxin system RelB/DinJ family antitoxin [Treponema sp.]